MGQSEIEVQSTGAYIMQSFRQIYSRAIIRLTVTRPDYQCTKHSLFNVYILQSFNSLTLATV